MVRRGFSIMAAVLLAVGSLLSIRDAGGPPSPISVASAEVQRSEPTPPRYSSKPIRDIQPIADRVLADNPETPGQAPSDFGEFDRESWRIVRLELPKPDGEWLRVTLARPLTWLETAGRDDHGRLWLEFKELGIANWANVLAIEPCPEAAIGEGRLVTGKFEHSSADVIDLFVDGVSEPIGTTSNHPFWSEDRRDFVQAGRLRIGERLRLRDGSTPVVTAAVPRSESVPVFNLEVDGEHVYYVAASGVLVHNAYEYPDRISLGLSEDGKLEEFSGNFDGKSPMFPFGDDTPGDPWDKITAAMDEAEVIDFNMEGVEEAHFQNWLKDPVVGPPETFTNAELHRILTNPDLLDKTIFWNGKPPLDWLP